MLLGIGLLCTIRQFDSCNLLFTQAILDLVETDEACATSSSQVVTRAHDQLALAYDVLAAANIVVSEDSVYVYMKTRKR